MDSPYQSIINEGFNDEELVGHLSKKYNDPQLNDKYQRAIAEGFSPQEYFDAYINKRKKPQEESSLKSKARTAAQIPLGILDLTAPGIAANLIQLIGTGESLDPEEIEHLKMISEREGIPFDEEKYLEAVKQASESFPTVSNIARMTEEKTGLPLEPKTTGQKLLRFASGAGKAVPGTLAQKTVAGATGAGTKAILQQMGVPEFISDIAGYGAAGGAGLKTPPIEITKAKKPSGLPIRGFEKIREPREVPKSKIESINQKIESDFKNISSKIIEESPIGETFENLKNDPTFKQESRELLNEAQEIANSIPGQKTNTILKKETADIAKRKKKGFVDSEYDKSYSKFMNENLNEIPENITASQMVEQYRKNNEALREYFEPGQSKALNRAKRDSLLDQNRAIASAMEKYYPESELVPVFKQGNERWTKIMDAEAVDEFVNELFSDKINYRKMHDFFDKQGYEFKFKRALGEEGYQNFQSLLKDMLESETSYKMLKVAKDKGFNDLYKIATAFLFHPIVGKAKFGIEAGKYISKKLTNFLLDKPKMTFKLKQAVNDLKKGKFKESEKEFKILQGEILPEFLEIEHQPKLIKNID